MKAGFKKRYTIKNISIRITKGTTPTTMGRPFIEDGINFIKAEALNGDTSLERSGFAFIDEITHQMLSRSILEIDDVLVTIAGANTGKCGFVTESDLPANTNQAVGIVRVDKEKAYPRYIYYFFKLKSTFEYIQTLSSQSAQPNLNLANLGNIQIDLPAKDVQYRIASILSAYDDLIENNRRRIRLLEDSARLLYREWFVRLRFPGHEHVRITDGVPVGWERRRLSNIAETNVDSYKAKGLPDTINYVDISSVSDGRITSKCSMGSADAPGRARRKAKSGDIIWSNVRPNLRAYALVLNPEENDVFSTGFTVLSPVAVPFSYLYQLVTTDEFINHLVNCTTGASYPAVRSDDFERAIALIPSQKILDLFHKKTEPIYMQIYILEKEIEFLQNGRNLLLPRLMKEEIVV